MLSGVVGDPVGEVAPALPDLAAVPRTSYTPHFARCGRPDPAPGAAVEFRGGRPAPVRRPGGGVLHLSGPARAGRPAPGPAASEVGGCRPGRWIRAPAPAR